MEEEDELDEEREFEFELEFEVKFASVVEADLLFWREKEERIEFEEGREEDEEDEEGCGREKDEFDANESNEFFWWSLEKLSNINWRLLKSGAK